LLVLFGAVAGFLSAISIALLLNALEHRRKAAPDSLTTG
jgi:hypothetical protein